MEDITVSVGGSSYESWLELNVRAAFHEACRSFAFTIAAAQGAATTNAIFQLGTPIQIMAGGELMLDGYVNRRKPKFDKSSATITIIGRSKGQDHVDCTGMHDTGYFENQDPAEIGNALGQFDAQFVADGQLDKLDYYQHTPGETPFGAVDEMCRDQGKTLCGQPNGDIKITDASNAQKHAGALVEGVNMEEAEGDFSDENRHSETHVRGQHPKGHGEWVLRQEARAMDNGVRRHRPHVHHHHGKATRDQVKKRAEDLRNRKAGHSVRAAIMVPSWRDDGGTLWTPGWRTFTTSPFLDLDQDMLIESIDFRAKAKGEGTSGWFGLVDPQAYGGEAGKASGSGSGWAMDSSAAQ